MEEVKKVTITTTIRQDILHQFKVECAKAGIPMNEVIEKAMIEYIEQQKEA